MKGQLIFDVYLLVYENSMIYEKQLIWQCSLERKKKKNVGVKRKEKQKQCCIWGRWSNK